MEDMSRKFYTTNETAEILGVSRLWIYEAIKAGRIPSVKLGKRHLIPAKYLRSLEERAYAGAGAGGEGR